MARTFTQVVSSHLDRMRQAGDGSNSGAVEYALRGVQRSSTARSNPRVLTAAGSRIFTMRPERMKALAGNRQAWQPVAWQYRDSIGELRFALQYRARALSKISFHVAEIIPGDDEPLPVSLRDEVDQEGKPTDRSQKITTPPDLAAAAEKELARLPLEDGYGFQGVWSENQDVAGECWLHGYLDPDTGEETWKIRSVLDVGTQGSTMTVKDELGQPRIIQLGTKDDPGPEEIYRLWVPHPAHGHLADSALKAMLDVLEDITLYGREMRAVSRSRIANNGVWLVPENMANLRNILTDSENAEDGPSNFMMAVQAMFLAPIANEGEPGGVVPGIIAGSREDIEVAMKSHLRFERESSADIINKLKTALGRMGNSLDLPPEVITGMADVNHWTGWLIDASSFRYHLEPSVRLQVDSLTGPFLRANLIEQGFDPEQVRKLRVWFEAGQLTENPNRRQDALDALDHILIGPAAGRKALGFSEGDAPTPEEALRLIAAKAGIDQATAAALIGTFAEQSGLDVPELQDPVVRAKATRVEAPPQTSGDTPADPTAPGDMPGTAPSGITAAADPPRYRLDTDTARSLAQLEQALRLELLSIADAATDRALERAGSRLRAKATKQPAVAAELAALPVTQWARRMGRTQAFGLGADVRFLLNDAWATLKGAFYRKINLALNAITTRLSSQLLRDRLGAPAAELARQRMHAEMLSRVDDAWARLEDRLSANAERLMFDGDMVEEVGELTDLSVPPALMRAALAEIGGLPETSAGIGQGFTAEPIGGLSTGATVSRELDAAGIEPVGYLWVYGVTPLAREFPPHRDLEGQRFSGWADDKLTPEPRYAFIGSFYHPGDHRGCMCDYVPAYAVPAYADTIAERLRQPSKPTQMLLDLAAKDDAAGRKGTTAQEARDQWQAIQDLQSRFINGG